MKSRTAITIIFLIVIVYSQPFHTAADEDNNPIPSPQETVRNFYSLFLEPEKRDDRWFDELQKKVRSFVTGDLNDFVMESCDHDYFIKGQDIVEDWLQKMRILSVYEDSSRGKAQVVVGYGPLPVLIVKPVREGTKWKINSVIDPEETDRTSLAKRRLTKQNFSPDSPAAMVLNFYTLYVSEMEEQKIPCRSTLRKFVTDRCLDYINLGCLYYFRHSSQEQKQFQILKTQFTNTISSVDFRAIVTVFGQTEGELLVTKLY